ncbi:hypothetical protein LTR78_005334 [Recurvomyces mirabilis]|uniref:Integral membrane protein n=1 Tax=Recurvomyces mirabilis TaxID=574656 RepID=A0AAE0WNE7_9PEZI|nr:hypothetical protein LTR78_005334 [Recurvomyces mirabilis]KAK5157886.1 hypothetical protein LTS14_003808 [Recurvomyces mirabilis]
MGKAGRIACITIPWALTVASFLCLILIETSGWTNTTSTSQFYFLQADFRNLSTASASNLANTTTLTAALELAQSENQLAKLYQIHLWNYCSSSKTDGSIDFCSKKESQFVFDPLSVWGLNGTNATSSSSDSAAANNVVQSEINQAKDSAEGLENKLLGKSGKAALDTYRHVAKWMFIAYEISFWTTLATIVCGILAIFSRWGSFFTWLFSIASTFFTFASVLTSTILFGTLTGALEALLHPYNIKLSLGTHSLILNWLSVAFSLGATAFWLLSICCCSGRSNPHHRSNKGGLWNAEPKGQGYGDYNAGSGRGRGLRVEKTGGGYERVSSPYLGDGGGGGGGEGDRVPLQPYPQQQQQQGGHYRQQSGAFEPYRHH